MSQVSRRIAFLLTTLALLAAPAAASGAIVNNGDFETGNFSGWQTQNAQFPGPGVWLVYSGNRSPITDFPVFAPPQGDRAAITDQNNISRQILYQDVALPAGVSTIQLSLIAYYSTPPGSSEFVSPNTLSLTVENEQYRIDVMRAGAPLASVAPSDVLVNLLRTRAGDPGNLAPVTKTADLSSFAGQTVRLRFAVVTTNHTLNGGVDAVSVTTRTNAFTLGEPVKNKKKGTALLPVTVPEAGTLSLAGAGVVPSSVPVGAGTANLLVKAAGKKKKKLKKKGKAGVDVTVTYTPNGLASKSENAEFKLKKKRKKKK